MSATSVGVSAPAKTATLRRDVGRTGLLFTSVGSIIGSGWLLGALGATNVAGPAAIFAWIGGALAIMLLALIHAELGGMFPVAGGIARFPGYAFGGMVGYVIGWAYWLGSVTLAPIEIEAALQYADKYINSGVGFHVMHEKGSQAVLTAPGLAVAAALMVLFAAINMYGIKRMSSTNTTVVWWKIAVPALTIVVLAVTAFHTSNFTAGDGFAPAGVKGILSAVATGGVIFSYLGFEQAIQFGGESRSPRRNIPFAVLGSMVIGTIVYILLQLVFVGALGPHAADHGWANLSFTNHFGPYAGLASGLGLGWLAVILYIDAFLSPAGTGLIYTGSASRLLYALGGDRYLPAALHRLNRRQVPALAIGVGFMVGMVLFLPFPGWQKLVKFITSASVLVFAAQCVTLAVLRRRAPDLERPFRLPAAGVLAPLGFVISNFIILFSGWTTDYKLFIAVLIGLAVLAIAQATRPADRRITPDWRSAGWVLPWLAGLAVITYLASFDGGRDTLRFGADMAVCAAFSLVVYALAVATALPAERILRNAAAASKGEDVQAAGAGAGAAAA